MPRKARQQHVRYGRVTVASVLPKHSAERLRREAANRGMTVSALIGQLVDDAFPAEVPPAKPAPTLSPLDKEMML